MASKNTLPVLNSRSDFQKLFEKGRRYYPSQWMIVNVHSNDKGTMRFGWTLPKFVGTAVTRNRLKRWCREYLRTNIDLKEKKAIDINFVFRRREKEFYKNLNHEELDRIFDNFFRKLT